MATKINPKPLRGVWTAGYALDFHTTRSVFAGHDEFGHRVFETLRPPMGELLYRLKYGMDRSVVPEIARTAADYLALWAIPVEAIVLVPPSRKRRPVQAVLDVGTALAGLTGLPILSSCLKKTKDTSELKDVFDLGKRSELLQDAFAVDAAKAKGKRILLFDDLYRSGATATAITRVLKEQGGAAAVYLLTLTRTRRNA